MWFYFHCGPSKKTLGGSGADVNQQKHTKNSNLKSDKESCQYDGNYNNNYYFSDNKDKK